MSNDKQEYLKISRMSVFELLDYVLGNPHLISDSYYKGYDKAIQDRADELLAKPIIRVKMGRRVI